jgi:rhodanese-related sulfurtransferase
VPATLAFPATSARLANMNKLFAALLLSIVAAVGCHQEAAPSASKAIVELASVTVEQLDTMVAAKQCIAVDANSVDTRRRMGVVPGALLLSDPQQFTMAELPGDKTQSMVFYCGGEMCKASHQAAQKAIAAGYSNVKIMSAGIAGWTTAGKKVTMM